MKRILLTLALLCAPLCLLASAQQIILTPQVTAATSITVTTSTSVVVVGGTASLSAVVNNPTPNIRFNQCPFTSSNTAVLSVLGNVVTGVGAGTATVACNWGGLVSNAVSITVDSSPLITNPNLTGCASPCVLPNATESTAYTFNFTASDVAPCCTWTVTVGSLPAGWTSAATLNSSTGVLSGTPNAATATTNFTIQACDTVSLCTTLAVRLNVVAGSVIPGAQLPLAWVNNQEGNTAVSAPTYTLTFPSSWTCGATNYGPYTAASQSSLQQALNDAEACRTANSGTPKILVKVPPALYTGTNGLVIPQTSTTAATGFIAVISTSDSSLPNGTLVCSHGMQDNLATSTDIGINNPDCAGDAMSYQLGSTVTTVSAGAFTLANGTPTNTSAYNDAANLYTLESSASAPRPLQFCSPTAASGSSSPPWCNGGAETTIGPDHWLIEDAEIRPVAGNTGTAVIVNTSSSTETTLAQLPSHIHLRKLWLHGDWPETVAGLSTGANSISVALNYSCVYCSFVDSQISETLRPGNDGHSIGPQFGQTQKINHNWVSGGSEGSLCGGNSAAPTIAGEVLCQNIEWRRNRFTFPYVWLGQLDLSGNPNWPTNPSLARKNAFEQKEGLYDLVDGNIFENVDNSGGQGGPYADWKSINTTIGTGLNYQSTTSNITATNDIFRNACNGIQVLGKGDGTSASFTGTSFGINKLFLQNDLFYNASVLTGIPGCTGVGKNGQEFSSNTGTWQGTIMGNGTTASFTGTCASSVTGNCPAGPLPGGMQQMDFVTGDFIVIAGCTGVPTFNTPTRVISSHTVPLLGSVVSAPSSGATVTWASSVSGTDATGTCTVSYIQGYPNAVTYSHNDFITDLANAFENDGNALAGNGPNYANNFTVLNSITLGGWFNASPAIPEGTPTEGYNWNPLTMTAAFDVWATRTAAKYTEYDNNSTFPAGSCTGAGCTPPVTMYYPSANALIGFSCSGCSTSVPLTLPDYHGYSLTPGGVYAAGGANQASDGTSMGVNIPAIDAAQTLNQYVCATTCGSPGPYADH